MSHRPYDVIKRGLDIMGSAIGLLIMSVPMLLVAAGVALTTGRPVLFRQLRVGRGERTFTLLKFRTMTVAEGPDGQPLPDVERVTPFGAFLRRTSLDELPQLINVLRGDMSLVGPRPLFVRYLPYYTERERQRHSIRPGITGLAQISGRNQLLWDERLELDVKYVENRSFCLDLLILIRTAARLWSRGDVIVIPGLVQRPLDQVRSAETIKRGAPKNDSSTSAGI